MEESRFTSSGESDRGSDRADATPTGGGLARGAAGISDGTMVGAGAVHALPPGTVLGSYRVLGALAEGGMSSVMLGEHVSSGREVAIKILKPGNRRDAELRARFVAEAEALRAVRHEHVVEVYEHGSTDDGVVYQVMELLEGETLAERLRRESHWSIGRILHVARQLADALSAAHDAGIVHRDLKPENVFLVRWVDDPDGDATLDQVKLLDFGLAKYRQVDDGSPALTRAGYTIGTPLYMSPEQCIGRLDVDERADIYALGVLIYEMATGQLPFASPNAFEVLAQQITAPFPSLCALRPDLPVELDEAVQKATRKDRDARFLSMPVMRDALDALAALPSPASTAPTGTAVSHRGPADVTCPGAPVSDSVPPGWQQAGWSLRLRLGSQLTDSQRRSGALEALGIAGPGSSDVADEVITDRLAGVERIDATPVRALAGAISGRFAVPGPSVELSGTSREWASGDRSFPDALRLEMTAPDLPALLPPEGRTSPELTLTLDAPLPVLRDGVDAAELDELRAAPTMITPRPVDPFAAPGESADRCTLADFRTAEITDRVTIGSRRLLPWLLIAGGALLVLLALLGRL